MLFATFGLVFSLVVMSLVFVVFSAIFGKKMWLRFHGWCKHGYTFCKTFCLQNSYDNFPKHGNFAVQFLPLHNDVSNMCRIEKNAMVTLERYMPYYN